MEVIKTKFSIFGAVNRGNKFLEYFCPSTLCALKVVDDFDENYISGRPRQQQQLQPSIILNVSLLYFLLLFGIIDR